MFLQEWSRSVIVSVGMVEFSRRFCGSSQVWSQFLWEWLGSVTVSMAAGESGHSFCGSR